ncbi:Na+/H+ antiporter subunit D [Natronoglycomyces albus]|uniref:Na+/H+ antiporter subunit D n=1 Tax=Natronoglycomyces albus TaxID=2811108 RepID=A0A895XN84_9ACTN|nr:Na+/H+ antiporter subunit D [Natronoglycomyces albus]
MDYIVPLPVLLPLLGAAVTLMVPRRSHLQRAVSTVVLSATLLAAIILLVYTWTEGPAVVAIGAWAPPVGIVLVADKLAAMMLVVSATMTLCVMLYAIGQGMADGNEGTPLSIYHPTFLVLTAGVTNAFLSGDLFNLYVGFEVLLVASFVLLTLGSTENRIRAGTTYAVVSILSSVVFLVAIGLIYAATGTLNLAQLAHRLDDLPDDLRLLLQIMLLLGFGIKAAVFPLSAWLPDSYPTAPAPVTAVFAGLLTKIGVYAIIRTDTLLFPDDRAVNYLMVAAGLTMVVGIMGAVAQTDIKRLLSFTLISHIGYMIFGVALATVAGLSGAIFYALHHITIQTTLFLGAGLIERRGGSTNLERLGGLARLSPVLAILFFVPALNLAGIPPFSGFLGKVGLMQAGVDVGTPLAYALVGSGALVSLLTLYAIARVWNLAFWRSPHPDMLLVGDIDRAGVAIRVREAAQPSVTSAAPSAATATKADPAIQGVPSGVILPKLMVIPTLILVAFSLALTIFAGPLFELTTESATDLLERTPYIEAVFPDGVPTGEAP